jgi:hypothetical protein
MFSSELWGLILQVLTSWQVIAVTVAVFFYFFLVNYTARLHHTRSISFSSKPKKKKKEKEKAVSEQKEAEITEEDVNDELGLEESR